MTEEEMLIFKQETEIQLADLKKQIVEKDESIDKLKEHNQKLFYSASALQEQQQEQEKQQEEEQQQEEKFDMNDFINKKRGRK